jgi:phosphatidylglycerophosphatase A
MLTKIASFIASLGGLGCIPVMPGTVASLAALTLFWFLPILSVSMMIALLSGAFLLGLLACYGVVGMRLEDPSWIVVDELAGMWVALAGLPHDPWVYGAAFILFRVFDIQKPFGIKKLEKFPGAWGVMLDDCAAGLLATCLVHSVFYIKPFWSAFC